MNAIDYAAPVVEEHKMECAEKNFDLTSMTAQERAAVESRLNLYNTALLASMRDKALMRHQPTPLNPNIQSVFLEPVDVRGEDRAHGLDLLQTGKIGCLVLAGGQGTRLGIKGPKGCLEVTPVCSKTLFALICDKIAAASALAGRELPVAIMTSPQNHDETVAYFKHFDNFGLSDTQVTFFQQNMLPLLDEEGALFLEKSGQLAEGPDGNGRALHLLAERGIADAWEKLGVTYVNVIPIDNPLADPFDYTMIGWQDRMDYDLVVKSIEKKSPEERVGVIGELEGHIEVIEYSELPQAQASLRRPDGQLHWNAVFTGLFSVRLDYVQTLHQLEMPWHIAVKEGSKVEQIGDQWVARPIQTLKFETFIFDSFRAAKRFSLYPIDRSEEFSPIKRGEGDDSVVQARHDLAERDRQHLKKLGVESKETIVECDPALYYLSENQLNDIKNRIIKRGQYYTFNK